MLLKNGLVCDHSQKIPADVRIQDGQITQIAPNLSSRADEQVIDCKGKIIAPTLIDLNVYPKGKSLSQKTLTSLSKKSLKGGVGTALILPDTTPACENEAMIELVKSIDSLTEITLIPSIKPTNAENKINDISILATQGGKVIYIDSRIDGNNLLKIMQYALMLEIPVVCFAQDIELAKGAMNEGALASMLGLPSISPLSQTKEIAKISQTARHTGAKILFSAITEPQGLEIIDYFKSKNATIIAQTPIHHLILDENACAHYNTKAKLNPPLKDPASKQQLLEALKNGQIDMLTSLQCADYNSQKDQVFELASFGIDAISYYFALAYTYLIKPEHIGIQDFLMLASKRQSDFLGLNKGEIAVGKDADLMIIDLEAHTEISDSFSPYYGQNLGQKLDSKIEYTIIGGNIYGEFYR
ncbi:amidohydrolase family protein [Helicobacter sp. 11S02596-1]|uniref:amidohydrolase family protein n=1 Tax=Helicobacter sp. 11S02596-1 TaxID=1476194 RepID=UPI000BA5117F|nr:amidohydrolase family protein [Helicobacter sp. 11S02596-1]PAF44854.1 hypothetical protein BJI48_02380 [Helicobacter sp. 11S02596-1]